MKKYESLIVYMLIALFAVTQVITYSKMSRRLYTLEQQQALNTKTIHILPRR